MASSTATRPTGADASAKERFLEAYEDEHARTMKVLRAYPPEKAELQPHPRCKTARELAWVFAIECGLGNHVFINDVFSKGGPSGKMPDAPATWGEVVAAVEQTHKDFAAQVRAMPDDKLNDTVKFFVAPRTLGDVRRMDFLWFLLHDEIHHRGQFSIYLRMADAKVPSIYGPSGDEPWM